MVICLGTTLYKMKTTYHEWKCIGCARVVRFTGGNIFSPMPYWFTLKTEGHVSSSERPSINTSVCSTTCLEKASVIIQDFIQSRSHSIPQKRHIKATFCDQCGKVTKVDKLNMVFGPSPLQSWTYEETPEGRKDFCSTECKKSHSVHPENSVFINFKSDDPWEMRRLIELVDAPDFVEQIKKPHKPIVGFSPTIREDIEKVNAEVADQQ